MTVEAGCGKGPGRGAPLISDMDVGVCYQPLRRLWSLLTDRFRLGAHSVFEAPAIDLPRLPNNHTERICRGGSMFMWRAGAGWILSSTALTADSTSSPMWGRTIVPPLVIAAYATASCSAVTCTSPGRRRG